MSRIPHVVSALIAITALASPLQAATAFMYIAGVAGTSPTDHEHEDWIIIESMSAPVQSDAPPTLGGLGPILGDIVIGKQADEHSATLQQAATLGTTFPKVKIDYCTNCGSPGGGAGSDIFFVGEWTAEVASFVNLGPSPGEPTSENFTLNFGQIKYEYSEQDADGNKDGSYKADWLNPALPPNTSTEGSPTGPFMLLNEFNIPEPATAVVLLWGVGLMVGMKRRA